MPPKQRKRRRRRRRKKNNDPQHSSNAGEITGAWAPAAHKAFASKVPANGAWAPAASKAFAAKVPATGAWAPKASAAKVPAERQLVDRICRKVSNSLNHRSTPTFEEVQDLFVAEGLSPEQMAEDRVLRACARLDPRPPPDHPSESFVHCLMHVCLHNLPGQLRKQPQYAVLRFDNDHAVRCQFPSLTHWALFAFNKTWRAQWEHFLGAPILPLPEKYSLGVGKYVGSWADAADSAESD